MSKEFRHLKFGAVPVELTDSQLAANEQILKSFLKNTGIGNFAQNTESHLEVFSIASQYIGGNFRNWMFANFHTGHGARSEFVRKMVGYINGDLSGMTVQNQLKIDNTKLGYAQPGAAISNPILYHERDFHHDNWTSDQVDFSAVKDRHMYDMFALLGPEGVARLCLSLAGVSNG